MCVHCSEYERCRRAIAQQFVDERVRDIPCVIGSANFISAGYAYWFSQSRSCAPYEQ